MSKKGKMTFENVMLVVLMSMTCNVDRTATIVRQRPPARPEEERLVIGMATEVYSFPYVCSIHYRSVSDILGTCTIFHSTWVTVNTDNIIYFEGSGVVKATDIIVIAGVSHAVWKNNDEFSYESGQKCIGEELYIAIDPYVVWNTSVALGDMVNSNLSSNNYALDVKGIAFNIGFLRVKGEFRWSPFVLPIPLYDWTITEMLEETSHVMERLESNPHAMGYCYATGWGTTYPRYMMFLKLLYVPIEACRETWCSEDQDYCLQFPLFTHLFCYKSLIYTDLCTYDHGTPLYCEHFGGSVLGILSKTLYCGMYHVPDVFTLISPITVMYSKLANKKTVRTSVGGNFFTTRAPRF